MKKVDVLKISYYPPNKGYAVLLKETDGVRQVPIMVGTNEAQAIAMALEGIEMPRPMTHNLLLNILHSLDVNVKHVNISDMRDGTFFAKITMTNSYSSEFTIDSRPSDAIAIALNSLSPIYVEEIVFNSIGIIEKNDTNQINQINQNQLKKTEPITSKDNMLENLNEALDKAVKDEEYEIAARLRDRINKINEN